MHGIIRYPYETKHAPPPPPIHKNDRGSFLFLHDCQSCAIKKMLSKDDFVGGIRIRTHYNVVHQS